jgi:hypothetical protein
VDNDILTKQYFPRDRTEEKRELLTVLIIVKANTSAVGEERDQQMSGPWILFLRGTRHQTKRLLQPLN